MTQPVAEFPANRPPGQHALLEAHTAWKTITYLAFRNGQIAEIQGILEVIMPMGTTIIKTTNQNYPDDLRTDCFHVVRIITEPDDMVAVGFGSEYKFAYRVGDSYATNELDRDPEHMLRPGLHVYRTYARARELWGSDKLPKVAPTV